MTTMSIILLCLLVASVALHVIAPMTKNKIDDTAVKVVDAVKDELGKK